MSGNPLDLRTWLAAIDKLGELKTVEGADWNLELGAISELNVKKDLPMNTPVEIPVKLDKEGKVGFQCGMAMVKGTINVGS